MLPAPDQVVARLAFDVITLAAGGLGIYFGSIARSDVLVLALTAVISHGTLTDVTSEL